MCKPVTVTNMVDVTTYTTALVTKTATRKVSKLVTETKTMPVTSTTYEAVTETVQVPVAASAGGCGTESGVNAGYGMGNGGSGCGTDACDSGKKGCKLFGRVKGIFSKKSSCGCN